MVEAKALHTSRRYHTFGLAQVIERLGFEQVEQILLSGVPLSRKEEILGKK